jgi:hypothetical protein
MDTHSHSEKKNNAPVTEQTSQEDFLPDELSVFSDFRGIQRAIKEPNLQLLTPNIILQLQRTIGNQAVQRLLAERMMVQRIPDENLVPFERPDTTPVQTRQLEFVSIKLRGRGIEHWWVEIDGAESYGWWPTSAPATDWEAAWSHGIVGVPGILNATNRPQLGGTATRDPHHGHSAPETFHPYTVNRSNSLSDDEIRQRIRSFARGFSGDYSIVLGPNCHSFISSMMGSIGLSMGRPISTSPIIPH